MATQQPGAMIPSAGLVELRTRWVWFLGFGILLDVLGVVALGSAFFVSMHFLGWILIIIGVLRGVHALRLKRWSGYFIDLMTALLYALVGILVVINPGAGNTTISFTLVIAMLLMLDGILHIARSFMVRSPNWRWLLVNGILVLLFGIGLVIWQQFSHFRVWVIAWILGITIFINGWSLIVLGWAGKKLPESSGDDLSYRNSGNPQ